MRTDEQIKRLGDRDIAPMIKRLGDRDIAPMIKRLGDRDIAPMTLTKAETFALYSLLSILHLQLGRWSLKSPRLSLCFNGPIDMPNQNCSVHPPLILVALLSNQFIVLQP